MREPQRFAIEVGNLRHGKLNGPCGGQLHSSQEIACG